MVVLVRHLIYLSMCMVALFRHLIYLSMCMVALVTFNILEHGYGGYG